MLASTFDINSNPASANNDHFKIIITDATTGIAQTLNQENHSAISVFSNPANNYLQLITGNNVVTEVSIYDITGKEGLYFISAQISDGFVQKIKFVKQ